MKIKLVAENNYKTEKSDGREYAVTMAVQRMINRKLERTNVNK